MGRCGCSSVGASGAAISDGDCLSVSGAGTIGSPFVLDPIVDPDATNLLECGPAGLLVPDPDNPGAWTAYTPTWTSSGTPPSAPAGTLLGYYRERGKSVEVSIYWTSNGSTLGTGFWSFGLPPGLVPVLPAAFAAFVGIGASGNLYPGVGLAGSGQNKIDVIMVPAAGGAAGPVPVGDALPEAAGWTLNSYIALSGLFQAV